MTSKADSIIILKTPQKQTLFWGSWVLANALAVAVITAVGLILGYIPQAIVGWIGVGVVLAFTQQMVLNHYARLNYWGVVTVLGWSAGVLIGRIAIGWQAAGWDLDWAVTGVCLGLAQMLVLRQQFRGTGWWLLASSTGLVLASALGGATSLLPDWLVYKGFIFFDKRLAEIIGLTLATAVGGAVNGAITGGWLIWFLRSPE